MLYALPILSLADAVAVGAASATFPVITTMAVGQRFVFVANTACWIAQGAAPVASAAAGSMFVPANTQVMIDGANGARLAVIQDAVAGKASLTPART